MTDAAARPPAGAQLRARGDAAPEPAVKGVVHWIDHPARLTVIAAVVGWMALYFAFQNHWLGLVLAVATTVVGIAAAERGRIRSRARTAQLQAAVEAAAARNRELDLLRGLGATLLRVRSSGELLDEAAVRANSLLKSQGSALVLTAEEGRFLRIAAGAGRLRSAVGSLVPMDRSLAGWCVAHDQALVSDQTERDHRNYPVELIPQDLTRMIAVPLRSSGVVIGAVAALNRQGDPPYTDHDVTLITALAEQVAVGLDRAFMLEETRRNEQTLAEKNRELVRVTKLKDEFLANMSHEFRTPLNAIIGFSELLLATPGKELDAEQRDFLESIARNGRHLLGLITNILDLSKIEAGRMTVHLTRADLRESVRAAVADTGSIRMTKRQECSLAEGPVSLDVVADHTRVRQVLINLLSNATKFTPEGGIIHVAVQAASVSLPVPGSRAGEVPRLVPRDAVRVTVRDSGIGIQTEDLDKLFKTFSQIDSSASRPQQGTGLGLALCKQFVEMHGGTIGVESVYGEGSSFWFVLPKDGPVRQPQ
ncbi:MAG: ATP-binding protein [Gemmatimonadales bacterium]